MNIAAYTGLAYNFRTYHCWHHVRRVRADIGLETPEFDVISPTKITEAFDAGHADPKGLTLASQPQDYDAVLFGTVHAGRWVWHAGVYVGGFVSHCDLEAKQVKLESLTDMKDRYQRIEFWR